MIFRNVKRCVSHVMFLKSDIICTVEILKKRMYLTAKEGVFLKWVKVNSVWVKVFRRWCRLKSLVRPASTVCEMLDYCHYFHDACESTHICQVETTCWWWWSNRCAKPPPSLSLDIIWKPLSANLCFFPNQSIKPLHPVTGQVFWRCWPGWKRLFQTASVAFCAERRCMKAVEERLCVSVCSYPNPNTWTGLPPVCGTDPSVPTITIKN